MTARKTCIHLLSTTGSAAPTERRSAQDGLGADRGPVLVRGLRRRVALAGAIAMLLAPLAACGKKGEPDPPPGQKNTFPKSYPPPGS
jgi:predicted small lipoprotein YifL